MTSKIEMGKQYRTSGGRNVRVLCTDRKGDWPVVALVPDSTRPIEILVSYSSEGHANLNKSLSDYDLVEIKPRINRTYWANIYKNSKVDSFIAYPSKDLADSMGFGSGRLACVPITIDCEEGEGLDK